MRVAMIVPEDPAVAWHGGTMRTAAFARAFTELGHDVEMLLPRTAQADAPALAVNMVTGRSRLSGIKRALSPMPTAAGQLAQRGSQVRQHLDRFDVVFFSNFESRIMVPRHVRPRVWFDQSDVHSRYAFSEAAYRHGVAAASARVQGRWLSVQERRWVDQARASTAAGHGDAMNTPGVRGRVEWLPNPIDVADQDLAAQPGQNIVGMIGNFGYNPNRQAYDYFVDLWLPVVRKQGWRLLVAGRRSQTLPPAAGVELLGPVDDVADFYRRIDVAACPVDRGGGIKVKAVEALCHGRPVLASEHTSDGLGPDFASLLAVCSDPSALPALEELRCTTDQLAAVRRRFSSAEFTRHVSSLLPRWGTHAV